MSVAVPRDRCCVATGERVLSLSSAREDCGGASLLEVRAEPADATQEEQQALQVEATVAVGDCPTLLAVLVVANDLTLATPPLLVDDTAATIDLRPIDERLEPVEAVTVRISDAWGARIAEIRGRFRAGETSRATPRTGLSGLGAHSRPGSGPFTRSSSESSDTASTRSATRSGPAMTPTNPRLTSPPTKPTK